MMRLTVRVDLAEDAAIGPGKARLLETIGKTGSIRAAAARMDMSYRRAWLLLKDLQVVFGVPVIATATGGRKGGGTSLTEAGRQIVKCYRQIEWKASLAAAEQMQALSAISRTPVRKPRKRSVK